MGLDVTFIKREEIKYYRKVNFFITYFDIQDEDNGRDRCISKEELTEFVADLKIELKLYKDRCAEQEKDGNIEVPPINPKFDTCELPFGGSTKYTIEYWEDMQDAYNWAKDQLELFKWDSCTMAINCWW